MATEVREGRTREFLAACENVGDLEELMPWIELSLVNSVVERGVYGRLGALHRAADQGRVDLMRFLVGHGADLELKDMEGNPPLIVACSQELEIGEVACVAARALIEMGADIEAVDARGHAALSSAAANGSTGCVALLIEHGARVDRQGPQGVAALGYACANDRLEAARLLIDAGARIESGSPGVAPSPLDLACYHGSRYCLDELIARGARVDTRDAKGRAPLARACFTEFEYGARALIRAGCDIDARDDAGRLAMDVLNPSDAVAAMILEMIGRERAEREAREVERELGHGQEPARNRPHAL